MKNIKNATAKCIAALCTAALSLTAIPAIPTDAAEEDTFSVVTTIFPIYDWVREILGDQAEHVNLTMLLDNGTDLHNYQPTADDIIKISTCDLFLYVGGESDEWTEDVLKGASNPDMITVNLLEVLGDSAKVEELVEGMEHSHEDVHEDEHTHEHGEGEYDEHVWLSLKNASVLCREIAGKLSEIDEEHAALYNGNAEAYCEKLGALDEQYQEAVDNASVKTLLFGDRFPFRYLTDDYGLSYYAAFSGCSAEAEASFETIAFLSGKVDELGLSSVITLEGTEHKIAETIVSATKSKDAQILVMDSMQSTTSADVKEGKSYLNVMENNLEVLKQALK